jgi:hypothetical protein
MMRRSHQKRMRTLSHCMDAVCLRRSTASAAAIPASSTRTPRCTRPHDEEDEREPKQGKARKKKPIYLKDVNTCQLLEEGPEFGE